MTQAMNDKHESHRRALDARETQLQQHVEHCSAAIRDADGHDPSLGRELDAARSLLAQVHAESALLPVDEPAPAR
jgi:hypothetical protein